MSFIDNPKQVLVFNLPLKVFLQAPVVTLPSHYLRQIGEQISDMKVDMHSWLARSQLQESQLDDSEQALSFARFRQLVLDAVSMTQEPALGLLVGNRLLLKTHGILGLAAMSSSTLRQAIEVVGAYSLLRTPLVAIRHETVDHEFRVTFTERFAMGEIRQTVLDAAVLTVKNVVDALALGTQPVTRVGFAFPRPDYAPLASELFQCPVNYGQAWTGFSLPVAAVDTPLTQSDRRTYREAVLMCQREMERIVPDDSLAMRVRCVLLEHRDAFPSLNLMARLLHMTPRTLHRRLLGEETSYREILEDVRRSLANEHLKAGRLNIQEIAFALGYTDAANFRRAFKRWAGTAPSEIRTKGEKQLSIAKDGVGQ